MARFADMHDDIVAERDDAPCWQKLSA